MALSEDVIEEVVEQMRVAARQRRGLVRDQVVKEYRELVSLPRGERLAERKRRIGAAISYIHQSVPARTESNALIANQRFRETLVPHLGEVSDEDLKTIMDRAKRLIDEDRREEVHEIMRQVHGHVSPGRRGSEKRVRVEL